LEHIPLEGRADFLKACGEDRRVVEGSGDYAA
jgi:hypothetical protein